MKMKKILSAVLALTLVLALTACFGGNNDPTDGTTGSNDGATVGDTAANGVTYFTMELTVDTVPEITIFVMENEDGTVYLEYLGDVRKVDYAMDASVMAEIANALEQSGLIAFNGSDEYGDGNASGSFYCEYADGTTVSGGLYGAMTEEFENAIRAMDDAMQTILEDVPVYTPEAMVNGNVDAALLAAMQNILSATGIQTLDQFAISGIALDEYFGSAAGLSGADGISSAISCAPNMTTTAYSLVIVTVEDESDIGSVRADFAENMDWLKWVCVEPGDAIIAQNGNMVLCLMADGDLFTQTSSAITAAGWTNVETFHNPNR